MGSIMYFGRRSKVYGKRVWPPFAAISIEIRRWKSRDGDLQAGVWRRFSSSSHTEAHYMARLKEIQDRADGFRARAPLK
jgi:hypothetical protein